MPRTELTENTVSEYIESSCILKKFKITRQTLWRWMNREIRPFPEPRIGSDSRNQHNKWALEDVLSWEKREFG
jgi:predicted DNA-binding transcriptional regulator AlpA